MISAYLHLVYSTGFSSAMLWLVCWIWILRGSAANKTGKGKEDSLKQSYKTVRKTPVSLGLVSAFFLYNRQCYTSQTISKIFTVYNSLTSSLLANTVTTMKYYEMVWYV